jgi:ferredoxin
MVAEYDSLSLEERGTFWQQQFLKCIKCYGCRNICPECFCEACSMEDVAWVEPGVLAPPFPTFHLIRAMHMASRCIGCRECEHVCPAHIPLTVLYDLIRRDVEGLLGYLPGRDIDAPPPLSIPLDQAGLLQGDPHQPNMIPLRLVE